LLLYGQTLALNHLVATKQTNIVKLEQLIDYGSGNTESIFSKLHIHTYHGDDMFSKFIFRSGGYDMLDVSQSPLNEINLVKYYCLNMALESRRKSPSELHKMLHNVTSKKNIK
jgi:hypothetical protein